MIVYKFGGTSVGSAERMKKVASIIIHDKRPKVVVLSAVSGTTNILVEIGSLLVKGSQDAAFKLIQSLKNDYRQLIGELYSDRKYSEIANEVIEKYFEQLSVWTKIPDFNEGNNKTILTYGELLSTNLFHLYLNEIKVNNQLTSAFDFMTIDQEGEPEIEKIGINLKSVITKSELTVTQGFICKNHLGQTDNLKRGGSDYSASIIGAAIKAEEIQIWTDIDGMHNNDPRIVDKTRPIKNLTFDEAAELAYFGAKILHPTSILPAQKYGIPVRLKSTLNPDASGTIIGTNSDEADIKAIAAKGNITAVKIKSSRMLLAHGFLKNVFEIFSKHSTSIDMITTSEVAVSVTIDDDKNLDQIEKELKEFGLVEIDKNQTIICIVGNMVSQKSGVLKKIFGTLADTPIRMVSYGGSRHNISLLIDSSLKSETLQKLNNGLF